MTTIEVLSAGPLTTIQDLGRPGLAHIGVPRSGAADRPALRRANRLAGNPESTPALETTLVGPRLRFDGASVVVLSGAPVRATVNGRPVEMESRIQLGDGDVLNVGSARAGLRTYVAFSGGLTAPLTLGSAATDLLTGLGPKPLARGDRLELGETRAGEMPAGEASADEAPADEVRRAPDFALAADAEPLVLAVALGPREDWFTGEARARLLRDPFTVTAESNRVGLRLSGPALERARDEQLLSEGLVPGAIQVPPNGLPIMLLCDHPTTGGYPVIATLLSGSLPLAGQLRPGQQLRFKRGT